MISKKGSSYVVKDSKGKKVLGTHKTRTGALAQLRAIEASKAANKKSKKPSRTRKKKQGKK